MTERKKERKEERKERKSDFLNIVSWSSERREEIESKGDIPPSLMTLFFQFFLPYFSPFAIGSCMYETEFILGPRQK